MNRIIVFVSLVVLVFEQLSVHAQKKPKQGIIDFGRKPQWNENSLRDETCDSQTSQTVPVVRNYDLEIAVQPVESRYSAEARVRLINLTRQPVEQVPFLLYRLVRVAKVVDLNGKPLQFHQELTAMSDEPNWQINCVLVHLPTPLAHNASVEMTLTFGGSIWGYREVMPYVQDKIDEHYALLRAETMAYPIVAQPSTTGWISAQAKPFTYRIRTTVPTGWIVACGDSNRTKTVSGGQAVFECDSDVPREHIEIAVAKFQVIEDAVSGARIYALQEDAEASQRVLKDLKRARTYFGTYFGHPAKGGYTVIEIPDGWGSQASAGYCIQTPDVFRDSTKIVQLYHELAHGWNAQAEGEMQRTRYFDEAFASYFAGLAVREFSGGAAFASEMERLRSSFITLAKRDQRYATVPINEWGESELGDGSYTKGAWSLYVLNRVLGDDGFRKAVSNFVNNYSSKPADFSSFQQQLQRSTGQTLTPFFGRWIYGTGSSQDLIEGKSIQEMVAAVK